MSLKLFTATSIKSFEDSIKEFYLENTSVFQPLYVVVENTSTKDYLKYSLAKRVNIVANVQFKKTNELIELISKTFNLHTGVTELLKAGQLKWMIYSIFDSLEFKERFSEVATYFEENNLKRFTLSEKVAALFDRYQNLQPEIIKNWNKEDYIPVKLEEEWQCFIWRSILVKVGDRLPDKTKAIEKIIIALNSRENQEILRAKLPRIAFFGQVEYTSDLFRLLKDLSNHIQVCIYQPDVTLHLTSENQNRLVKNFGSFLKSQKELIKGQGIITEELSNTINRSSKTLLASLQNHILTGEVPKAESPIDSSITINNCFSRSREVEVLYNYILQQFEKDKELGAKDICVIAPDINEYAAAIKAFFSNNKYEVKFSLYDSSYNIAESPYAALLSVLNIDENYLTSEVVLELLDFKYLREKFGFSEDISVVRRAIKSANICHGIDGKVDLETNYVSWRYGLKRLIYGFCLNSTEALVNIDDTDFYPVDEFEGNETFDLVRLHCLVENLSEFIDERKGSKTLTDWFVFLENQINNFLDTSEFSLTYFYSLVKGNEVNIDLINTDKIPYSVFKHYISSILNEMEDSTKSGFQGIRFTSLNPFNSAPAKIYAFLGMNNSDFPRQQTRLSFDLTDERIRTTNDLDKHLFLNCLLSAESKFYISYVGQSIKDNSSIPPSPVVDELLAAIEPLLVKSSDKVKTIDELIVKHPLHGFSNIYNNDLKLVRYITKTNLKNIIKDKGDEPKKESFSNEINLNDLTRFLIDPFKWYYNKVLGVYYNEEEATLPENELFELDYLQQWIIKDELFRLEKYTDQELEAIRLEKVRKGLVPHSNSGAKMLNNLNNEIVDLKYLVSKFTDGFDNTSVTINEPLGKYCIKGEVNSVFNNNLIFGTLSSDKHKYRLKAFIHYLAILASGKINNHRLFYFHKESVNELIVDGISSSQAKIVLEKWCGYFEMGQQKILAFTTDFGKFTAANVKTIKEKNPNFTDQKRVLNSQIQDFRYPFGECYLSAYLKKEIDTGYFEDDNNVSDFFEIYIDIIEKLDLYFTKKKEEK